MIRAIVSAGSDLAPPRIAGDIQIFGVHFKMFQVVITVFIPAQLAGASVIQE